MFGSNTSVCSRIIQAGRRNVDHVDTVIVVLLYKPFIEYPHLKLGVVVFTKDLYAFTNICFLISWKYSIANFFYIVKVMVITNKLNYTNFICAN